MIYSVVVRSEDTRHGVYSPLRWRTKYERVLNLPAGVDLATVLYMALAECGQSSEGAKVEVSPEGNLARIVVKSDDVVVYLAAVVAIPADAECVITEKAK